MIPFFGTWIGAALGGLAGEWVGGWLYDRIVKNKKDYSGPKAEQKNEKGDIYGYAVAFTDPTGGMGKKFWSGWAPSASESANPSVRSGLLQESPQSIWLREQLEKIQNRGVIIPSHSSELQSQQLNQLSKDVAINKKLNNNKVNFSTTTLIQSNNTTGINIATGPFTSLNNSSETVPEPAVV